MSGYAAVGRPKIYDETVDDELRSDISQLLLLADRINKNMRAQLGTSAYPSLRMRVIVDKITAINTLIAQGE